MVKAETLMKSSKTILMRTPILDGGKMEMLLDKYQTSLATKVKIR